jgi:hypothetical protein
MSMSMNLSPARLPATPDLAGEFVRSLVPGFVLLRQTDAAGPIAGGARVSLVKEEDAIGDVASACDRAQRGAALEAAVDAAAAVAAQRPGSVR